MAQAGREIAVKLCELFGLEPDEVQSLSFSAEACGLFRINVSFYPNKKPTLEEAFKSYGLVDLNTPVVAPDYANGIYTAAQMKRAYLEGADSVKIKARQ